MVLRTFRHRRSSHEAVLAGVIAVALSGLAACSSGGDGASSPTSPATTVSNPTSSTSSGDPATNVGGTSGPTASSTSTSPSSGPTSVLAPSGTQPASGPTVPITSVATFDGKVTGQIDKIADVTASGTGAGQTKGPGLALTITIKNASSAPIDLSSAVVNLAIGAAKTPGDPADGPPARPFKGSVKSGESATAVYVFRVDQTHGALLVTVSYSPVAPAVTFTGSKA